MSNTIASSASGARKIGKGGNPLALTKSLLFTAITGLSCFYSGLMIGTSMGVNSAVNAPSTKDAACWSSTDARLETIIQERVQQQVKLKIDKATANLLQQVERRQKHHGVGADTATITEEAPRFPPDTMGRYAVGMSRVDRDDFAAKYDTGVPLDKSDRGNRDVLILYSRQSSLPSNPFYKDSSKTSTEIPKIDSVEDAVENCHNLHVVLTDFNREKQCVAIMGQYEAFHVQKFMRLPPDGAVTLGLDAKQPLRLVNRGAQGNGRKSAKPPTRSQTLEYWGTLKTYLESFHSVLDRLKPITESVAKKNTVVVMVCNHGQSELLMNFVCNAKAKGLDLSAILVFATDQETKELCDGLGVTSFYDETNFGRMPKEAARAYADQNFMAMMAAKVYCVQMVCMLGYDVLFQDVDMIWNKDPLDWFHDESNPHHNFDIYFQDDGNHALFYAPYSANTGFYYIRHNDRTQYFFNSLLLSGDLILSTHSHQIALIALLNEHASMYGLTVKILERHTEEFPGGFTYHRKHDYMKAMVQGEIQPYIFHMSWTLNKKNKALYFQQLGEWYLDEKCAGGTVSSIGVSGHDALIQPCCLAEPKITCHYRDKPSKIPCTESPPIDKGGASFW